MELLAKLSINENTSAGPPWNSLASSHPHIRDVKNTREAILIYNDVKADLCIYMICQSMFITKDENVVLIHEYIEESKRRHGIKNYDVTPPLIQMVCVGLYS